MKDIKDVYPDLFNEEGGFWYIPWDYQPLVESFDFRTLVYHEDSKNQMTRVLFKDQDQYGILTFHWTNSIHSDPLQLCENYDDIKRLRDLLIKQIMWMNEEELNRWISHEYAKNQLSSRFTNDFFDKAKNYFN